MDSPNLLAPLLDIDDTQDQLRFLTCGSVDDGKSTLIGRLLHDAGLLYDDQLMTLYKKTAQDQTPDFSILLDGLLAEQEQGITIDVAYRSFATAKRRFIVADAPGHEQYTPNMVTAASNSELALILLDARLGLLPQTLRHTRIVTLLGIRTLALIVNKMDLAGYSRSHFEKLRGKFEKLAQKLGADQLVCIPVSALHGDNVVSPSSDMPWYQGPTLIQYLETVQPDRHEAELPLRLPVQWINHPDANFRGASGPLISGTLRTGDILCVAGTDTKSHAARIFVGDEERDEAHAGDPVTVTFTEHIDVSRGHILVADTGQPEIADQLCADIIWMGREPLLPGRLYLFKCGTIQCSMTVTAIKNRLDTNEQTALTSLAFNEMGHCTLRLSQAVPFEPYVRHRLLGGFIIIDRIRNATLGAGLIRHGLQQTVSSPWHQFSITREARSHAKGQKACVLWFTGLPSAGKSTLADLVERQLFAMGKHTYLLDSENVRHGLNGNLGFTPEDRVENIRRVGEVAHLMVDAGLIVLATFISPYQEERQMVRELFAEGEFFEIYVNTPLTICHQRDPKGLYHKAQAGLLRDFTGVDSPYAPPRKPDLTIYGDTQTPEALAAAIMHFLKENGVLTN